MKKEKINIVAPKNTKVKVESITKVEKLGRTILKPVGVKKSK